jgi:CRP/FNR family transcriptional regulator, cyclic AMP receptor protein
VRPWAELEELSIPSRPYWRADKESRVAELDAAFSQRVRAWPHIAAAIMERLALRTRWLGLTLAINAANRIDVRLLLLLWYCADRWGRVTRDGVFVELPLSHQYLAEIIGADRSSTLMTTPTKPHVVRGS